MINNINKMDNVLGAYKSNTNISPKLVNYEAPKDSVSLSSTAKDFQKILDVVSGLPDIREDKVAQLTNQVQSGSYNISSNDIANKILGNLS